MKRVFADTFYFLALLNRNDAAHRKAADFSAADDVPLVTTAWVLTELADALRRTHHRAKFLRFLDELQGDPESLIIPPSEAIFEEGLKLYRTRPDKDWSLTDCISFVVMKQHDISEALPGDRHVEQAGFRALLANGEA
jgi:predicted nucleic acid-binding protein